MNLHGFAEDVSVPGPHEELERMNSLRGEINGRFNEINSRFNTLCLLIIGSWVTIAAAVLRLTGVVLALAAG